MKIIEDNDYCRSCHAHWMQKCICTEEEVIAAEKRFEEIKNMRSVKVNLKKYIENKQKRNQNA